MPFFALVMSHTAGSHVSRLRGPVFEDRADLDGELATRMLLAALPPPLVGQEPRAREPAGGALHVTVRPAEADHEGQAGIGVGEMLGSRRIPEDDWQVG